MKVLPRLHNCHRTFYSRSPNHSMSASSSSSDMRRKYTSLLRLERWISIIVSVDFLNLPCRFLHGFLHILSFSSKLCLSEAVHYMLLYSSLYRLPWLPSWPSFSLEINFIL
ncbi:hypothetical protein KSP39_PZI009619 [Platanthera zijinensis]|uniref:Uncharacterized protein n=1 Tax=Platanthera zijinensis TaxID=2320716 RepID=A0AAP0G7F8_9ASPA